MNDINEQIKELDRFFAFVKQRDIELRNHFGNLLSKN